MSFRNVDSTTTAATYIDGLNQRWPIRPTIMATICGQLEQSPSTSLALLELCCGGGMLAYYLLTHLSTISYTGIDASPHLLAYAREILASFESRVTLVDADLNQEKWLDQVSSSHPTSDFDAIVSMQSIHDLGGEAEVSRIYGLAHQLLKSGGIFINADLIVQPGEVLPNNPGRCSIPKHLELLTNHGYTNLDCVLEDGGFACVVGRKV